MSEEEQMTNFVQNNGKQVNDFKQFIMKYSLISSY